jgi:LysM repeat protein
MAKAPKTGTMLYKKLFALIVLNTFLAASIFAQQRLFIQYDPACMDRLVYDLLLPEGPTEFVSYHINLKSGKKLILDVGKESPANYTTLPNGMLNCQTGGFDEAMMRRINANVDEVFVVLVQGGNVVAMSPVRLAGLYTNENEVITYQSPKYSLRFQEESAVIGENIAYQNPGANLYFEGREENTCTGNFLFRQLKPQSAYPKVDFKLAPEIGIIAETIGASSSGMANQTLTLRTINNEPVGSYLRRNCGMLPGETNPMVATTPRSPASYEAPQQPAAYGSVQQPAGMLLPPGAQVSPASSGYVPRTPAPTNYGTPAAPASYDQPTAAITTAATEATTTTHTVDRGETLFGISKQYGVTVTQLQEWNNLGKSTMIKRGQQLRVAPPAAAGMVARGVAETAAPPLPAAYDGGQARERSQPNPNEQTHIVKSGETVASVALMYGYTEDKFREINELGPQEIIRVGQRLKTSNCVCPEVGIQNQPASAGQPNNGLIRPQPGTTSSRGVMIGSATNPGLPVAPSGYDARSERITPDATAPAVGERGLPTAPAPTMRSAEPTYNPPTTISNDPDFGANAVIPRAYDTRPAPGEVSPASLRGLESRQMIGSASAPAASTARGTPVEYGTTYGNQQQARKVHIVQEGESLYTIARMYNMSVEELQQRNAMSPGEIIIPYQRLYVN